MAYNTASLPSALESRVVILPPTARDAAAMQKLLDGVGISHCMCASVSQLQTEIVKGSAALLISEEALMEQESDLEAMMLSQPVWSDLPLIVLSKSGVESPKLTASFPRLGNVTVVERPIRVTTFLSIVQSAIRARRRQYEVRAQLSAREEYARRLESSEERLRLAVTTGKLGVWELNLRTNEIHCSTDCKAMYGRGPDELLRFSDFLECVHPDDLDRVQSAAADSIARQTEYETEYRILWPDRSIHWVLARGRTTMPLDGTPDKMVGVTLDITERKAGEEQRAKLLDVERAARADAERAGRMKDEFLATISHELRTPLNAILGWIQVIKKKVKVEEFSEGIDIIERNARAQTRIIDDLLDMSRIISGKIKLEILPTDLVAVLTAATETVKPAAYAKNITITLDFESDKVEMSGDSNRLQQVFWNLLTNAVKFTANGGTIVVKLRTSESFAEINVKDTGEGISPAFLPFVFDRFSQADATTTRRHGGLGLGLAIVKQLTETHGGKVQVASEGIGKGTVFSVWIPIRSTYAGSESAVGSQNAVANSDVDAGCDDRNLSGLKVLVVDDEMDARELLKRVLEDGSAIVFTASSSDEAFHLLVSERPHLIISDIGMPDRDGYSLIRQVRNLPESEGGRTPAIALTAYARTQDYDSALSAGFQRHMTKPIEAHALIAAVVDLSKARNTAVKFLA